MAMSGPKPHVKLASTLVLLGMGLFSLERFGLDRLEGPSRAFHLDANVLSLLVAAPLLLVAAGAVTFVVGQMRRR